ncbi:CRISPR-associated helicase Cas3' [Kitasatospora sp. NBC_01300]|uniref:CRISPR-associated helicase Cas3' n=1 Tax=Kitasatospora sp. NBC_01300 TaxID=2903574 RepID=UPI00352C99EF|nr:CRISPR-associated helicase Cas3' [Kitasatospora sp. NBC_01300]
MWVLTLRQLLNVPTHQTIWGKTDQRRRSRGTGGPAWNPLTAHVLDTAACTGQLWDRYLTPGMRLRLAEAFGAGDEETARRTVMLLAGLHDLGKGSGCFLRSFGTGRDDDVLLRGRELEAWREQAFAAGLPGDAHPDGQADARHEHITAAHLPRILGCGCRPRCGGAGDEFPGLHTVALLLGGHHGHIPDLDTVERASGAAPMEAWEPVYRSLVTEAAELIGVPLPALPALVRPERPAVLAMFTGLVILADWIASSDDHFTYRRLGTPAADWWSASQHQARDAISDLALDRWRPEPRTWPELFPGTTPRPFQIAALAALPEDGPALVVIESGTGSGKTRLAFAIAHHLARTCGHQGLFMAMPTRAATNQAAGELEKFVRRSTGGATTNNLAVVHAAAEATDLVHRLIDAATTRQQNALRSLPDSVAVAAHDSGEAGDGKPDEVVLNPWYLRSCLGLVSTFGIGTVDQVVLIPQRNRHWMLRFLGLAGKTVVIDEAHAYQLFQQGMLGAAVEWLADAGASVVVLSATLPAPVREALVRAWCTGHRALARDTGGTGPVTVVDQGGTVRRAGEDEDGVVPVQPRRVGTEVRLQPLPGPTGLATQLLREAADGGITAVVRNRVASAVELHRTARDLGLRNGWRKDEIILLHGRLMGRDRLPLETRVVDALGPGSDTGGPNPGRPRRLLVIATQIIEQSLDVDFDRHYTDLAPIDLLIQRYGRLHRHHHNARPPWFREPALTVLWQPDGAELPVVEPPDRSNGRPHGNPDGGVYAPYTLAASWHALDRRAGEAGRFALDAREHGALIREVYGPSSPQPGALGQLLGRTEEDWHAAITNENNEVTARQVRPYGRRGRTPTTAYDLASGKAHGGGRDIGAPGIAALSRLGTPSIECLALYQQSNGALTYDRAGLLIADTLYHPADSRDRRSQQKDYLLNTLSIPVTWVSDRNGIPRPSTWPTLHRPALRYRRTALLDPTTGRCTSGPLGITYTPEEGLSR